MKTHAVRQLAMRVVREFFECENDARGGCFSIVCKGMSEHRFAPSPEIFSSGVEVRQWVLNGGLAAWRVTA